MDKDTYDYITEQYPIDVCEVISEAFPYLKGHYCALAVHFSKKPKDRWNIPKFDYPCQTYVVPFDFEVSFGGNTLFGETLFSKNFLTKLSGKFGEGDPPCPWETAEDLSAFLKEQNTILHHSLAHPKSFYSFLPPNKPAYRPAGIALRMDDNLLDMYQTMHDRNVPTSILFDHYRDLVRSEIVVRLFEKPEYTSKAMDKILDRLIQTKMPKFKKKKIFRSEIFCNHRKNLAVVLLIGVDKEFVRENKDLFLGKKYTTFISRAFQVIFDKWKDICEHDLYASDSNFIMNYRALLQLTAQDLTVGANLPSYEIFNRISSLRSEGAPCRGVIGFIPSGFDIHKQGIAFHWQNLPALMAPNARYIRKLLEMTGSIGQNTENEYILVSDGKKILGMAQRSVCEAGYMVEFFGLMNWQLTFKKREVFSFIEGKYLYRTPYHEDALQTMRDFLEYTPEEFAAARNLIETTVKQKHGTMLVIFKETSAAKEEASRLISYARGIRLQYPHCLNDSSLLLGLSSIDGAIILDKQLICHGFGIIVDGEACVNGTPSRGARYNSAWNYIQCCFQNGYQCLAVVISEDQTIDVITPTL